MNLLKIEERQWFRGLVIGVGIMVALVGSGRWIIDRADAQGKANAATITALDAGMTTAINQIRTDMAAESRQKDAKIERIESKVDEVLKELRKK